MIFIIGIFFMILSFAISSRLKSKFKKYSQTALVSNLSGKEVAERMLRDNGIYDVQVLCHQGSLTDHYNPANRSVNLSEPVYHGRNAAAAAIAAHECGHAVQHATAY
jgi:Zn-dependent membrane protease YugP